MTTQQSIGNARLRDADLQILLMERAERLHEEVERRIPASLKSLLSAEDILQEVWIAAFRGLSGFRADHPGALDRWLTTTADRKVLDAIRTARTLKRGGAHRIACPGQRRTSSCLDLFGRVACTQRSPSSEEGAREAQHAIQIALGALPDNYRQAITLFHLQGRSRAETAREMQTSVSALHGLLYRALGRLRRLLGPAKRFFSDDHETHRSFDDRGAVSV